MKERGFLMNNDLLNLYQRIQASSALTVILPSEFGSGIISRIYTPRGMHISNWTMQYYRDTCVEGISGREIRLMFCLGDGVEWETDKGRIRLDPGEACFTVYNGEKETLCYNGSCQYSFHSITLSPKKAFDLIQPYAAEPMDLFSRLDAKSFTITPEIYRNLRILQKLDTVGSGFKLMQTEARAQEMLSISIEAAAGCAFSPRIHRDDAELVRQIKRRIDLAPASVPEISKMAQEYGISVSKLSRSFKLQYGVTLHAYAIECRLCEGARLLAQQHLTVGEVSEIVGYSKQSQFSAAFKKRFGVSPKDY